LNINSLLKLSLEVKPYVVGDYLTFYLVTKEML